MVTRPHHSYLLLGATLVLCSVTAQADEYHYNNLLVGKNAVGLGGAFSAVADDLSTIYYNPAGLAQVGESKMASINTFAWEETNFENVFGNGADFKRSAFSVVPGFFGISHQTENWTLAAALMVTDYSKERSDDDVFYQSPAFAGNPATNNNEFISIDIDNSAYQIVGAGARKINQNWSFGFSLGLEYRAFQTTQASGTVISTPVSADVSLQNGFQATVRFSDDNLIIVPSVSFLYNNDQFSFAGKLAKSVVVNRDHKFTSSIFLTGIPVQVPNVNSAIRLLESACCKQKYPLNLTLGSAYRNGNWLFSGDINYFTKVDQKIESLELFGIPITKKLAATTNVAFGIAYQLNDIDSVKFGFFTDNSSSLIDTNVDFQRLEAIDLKGFSAAFDTTLIDLPFTFGVYYKFGEGPIRTADTRSVDTLVGLPLYPPSDTQDIANATRKTVVAYFSVNF